MVKTRATPAPPPVRVLPNRLLEALAVGGRQRFMAACDSIDLESGAVLHQAGAFIEYVYFPTSSFISVMIPVDEGSVLEVGLIGDEGMLGLPLLLGVDASSLRALVQGRGHAWRMEAETFGIELEHHPRLKRKLMRYMQVCICQLAQSAACTRFHMVEQRLARWLLMTQDRAHQDEFHVTHEFLAYMLGVRRVGVTKAATALQKRHLIQYHRGAVTVLDRLGMQLAACSCYQADRDTYEGLLPAADRRPRRLKPAMS
jgi:CRP-like cAMP-binding protein